MAVVYFQSICVECKNGEREWIQDNIRVPFCESCSKKRIAEKKCLFCGKNASAKNNHGFCTSCESKIEFDLGNFDVCTSCHAFKKSDRKHKICKKCFSVFMKNKICISCQNPLYHPHKIGKHQICDKCYTAFNPVCEECCAETCLRGKTVGERCYELSQK